MRNFLFVTVLIFSNNVFAGAYVEDLQRCLTQSSSEKDMILLTRWISRAINEHPNLIDLSNLDANKRADIDNKMAIYLTRIIDSDCKYEFQNVTKYEGNNGMTVAFEFLGKAAMTQLMQNKKVSDSASNFVKYLKK